MILKFKENRVNRAYIGGKNIDKFVGNKTQENGFKPEEWIASVVTAFNPDNPIENEGLSVCEDGRFFKDVLAEDYQKHLGVAKDSSVIKEMSILEKFGAILKAEYLEDISNVLRSMRNMSKNEKEKVSK